eukprot:ANDGO_01170.mRNA.1 hypothetical protein
MLTSFREKSTDASSAAGWPCRGEFVDSIAGGVRLPAGDVVNIQGLFSENATIQDMRAHVDVTGREY